VSADAIAAALEHVGATLVSQAAGWRLYDLTDPSLRWFITPDGRLYAADRSGSPWRPVSDRTHRTFVRVGDILMARRFRHDTQLALPLQDARAAAGRASAENTETARQRAAAAAGARPAPARLPTHTEAARAAGRAGMAAAEAAAERAIPDFTDRALAVALTILADGRDRTGEQLVDEIKATGLTPPRGDRSFGAVIHALVRRGHIRRVGYAPRTKGHGTAGASIWRRTGARAA